MALPGLLVTFQSPRHEGSLAPATAPLKPKEGLNGPPFLKQMEEFVDIYSFLFWQLGMTP